MSDFTPEQIKEIRRRIEDVCPKWSEGGAPYKVYLNDVLDRFPLPKVTRYRTFKRGADTYRVVGDRVEYVAGNNQWYLTTYGDGTRAGFAAEMIRTGDMTALLAFADVAARPTEEVDA